MVVSPAGPELSDRIEDADAPADAGDQGDDDWIAALWGRSRAPERQGVERARARPEAEARDEPEAEPTAVDRPDSPGAGGGADLSISDLLAEDLPIPEAEERALSIRDLLAEDLAVPEAEAEPPEAPAPEIEQAGPDEEAVPAEQAGSAEEGPTTPEDPGGSEAGGEGSEPEPGGESPSRPLPEAAPGRSLGGRLRRVWNTDDGES